MQESRVDVAIIGAGTAGMGAYRAASAFTKKIALIEGHLYGTTCARVGCMPSKLLISAADAAHAIAGAARFGVIASPSRIDGRAVMKRVRAERDRFVGFVVQSVEDEFDAAHRLHGRARFLDDHRLQVGDDRIVHAERIVIATGSRPVYPDAWMRDLGDRAIVNDDVFCWDDLPESVVVVGGGVIGLELAQSLHRLGVRVRHFGRGGGVGPLSDPDVRAYAVKTFADEYGFDPDANVQSIARDGDHVVVRFELGGVERTERFQYLLAATGRRPNIDQLGLEKTSLPLSPNGQPLFDRMTCQIGDSHVFIAGDANPDRPLLHEAADEGRIAGENAGRCPDVREGRRRAGLAVVFSDPQIAIAGSSYSELRSAGASFAIGEASFDDQGRARVAGKNKGILRVYGAHGSGEFLGAEMIAPQAEHLAHLLAWARQSKRTVDDMLESPFYHPVVEEGLRTALRVLLRNLRKGPTPVRRCMDCGPGA
jgi:dihydrolipoamide dehydrogenase